MGGGALSSATCQILADILGRKIEAVHNPQNVRALGAAIVVAVGMVYLRKKKRLKLQKTLVSFCLFLVMLC